MKSAVSQQSVPSQATCRCGGGTAAQRRAGAVRPAQTRVAASSGLIAAAQPRDVAAIAKLLGEAGLPHEDFAPHLAHFLVARSGEDVVGVVGAEVIGADALLRSLVVAPAARGAGLGEALVQRIETEAAGWGVQRWWLLTTTAEAFFAKRGFRVTPRSAAPAGIAATAEFRGLCPSVAVCLMRERRSA